MNSIIKIFILIALGLTALAGLFAMPADTSPAWLSDLILTKGAMAAAAYLFHKLYRRWRISDRWISSFDRWNDMSYTERQSTINEDDLQTHRND